ncbi:MAG: UDP-N-acetylmuramoyl-tripeptide--D-alanyl-D-alanine ligase, partial [Chitinophagales bacterium]|nr:UDP-N-acetylmuramoyl-tripeptide--D-alanyl-D-alanine ligase [Chitinophagales bacterium]
MRGPQHNGNAYVHQALAQGAIAAVADDPAMKGEKIICVEDVLKTLQQLAAHHRRQLRTTFIAIGGSNGKTTTKELTAAVLHKKFNVYATQGNRNNHIGVPLSLLEVRDATEVAVLEIGANHIGETAFLSELIAPQYGLITNNGKDHLEGYGSVEGVKRGNAELYEYLLAHDGLAFVHADDVELMQMSTGLRQFTYGSQSGADVRGELITAYPLVTVCVEQVVIHTRLT